MSQGHITPKGRTRALESILRDAVLALYTGVDTEEADKAYIRQPVAFQIDAGRAVSSEMVQFPAYAADARVNLMAWGLIAPDGLRVAEGRLRRPVRPMVGEQPTFPPGDIEVTIKDVILEPK